MQTPCLVPEILSLRARPRKRRVFYYLSGVRSNVTARCDPWGGTNLPRVRKESSVDESNASDDATTELARESPCRPARREVTAAAYGPPTVQSATGPRGTRHFRHYRTLIPRLYGLSAGLPIVGNTDVRLAVYAVTLSCVTHSGDSLLTQQKPRQRLLEAFRVVRHHGMARLGDDGQTTFRQHFIDHLVCGVRRQDVRGGAAHHESRAANPRQRRPLRLR